MPAANNNSGNASNAGSGPTTGGRDRPLNPALRPQRLFHKVEIAMKTVDKKLFDRTVTGFSDLLTDDDMAHFRRVIRRIIRTDYDASFDTWPKRVLHDYKSDARKAIIQAINECWDLFDATKMSNEIRTTTLCRERLGLGHHWMRVVMMRGSRTFDAYREIATGYVTP